MPIFDIHGGIFGHFKYFLQRGSRLGVTLINLSGYCFFTSDQRFFLLWRLFRLPWCACGLRPIFSTAGQVRRRIGGVARAQGQR